MLSTGIFSLIIISVTIKNIVVPILLQTGVLSIERKTIILTAIKTV